MRTTSRRFLSGAWRPAAFSLAALAAFLPSAQPAAAEPLGLLGIPARVYYREKHRGGPLYKPGDPDVEGRLVDETEDALVVLRKDTGERVEIPRESVARLDISRSRSGRPLLGALIGLGAGGLIGAAVPVDESDQFLAELDEDLTRAGNIVIGSLLGTVVGVIAGSAWKSDDWEEVPLDSRPLGVVPSLGPDGSPALELRLAFR